MSKPFDDLEMVIKESVLKILLTSPSGDPYFDVRKFVENLRGTAYSVNKNTGEIDIPLDKHSFNLLYRDFFALEKRVRKLEDRPVDVVEVLGELYSWVDNEQHIGIVGKERFGILQSFKDKIAGIQKRYGIG